MKVRVSTMRGYMVEDSRTQKYLEDRYNIDIDLVLLPGASDAPAKTSLLMGDDNERPDLVWWSGMEADFVKWVNAGLLVDLTGYVDKYPVMRDYLNSQDPRIMFYTSSAGNKFYRMPGDISEPGCETIWVRKDWMDKLGIAVPKTMTEFDAMLYRFANDDPDGNGKKDTYGWGTAQGDLRRFYPWWQGSGTGRGNIYSQFVRMADGSVAFGGATEDAKLWLTRVAKLYKDGVINPNAIISNVTTSEETNRGFNGGFHGWVASNNIGRGGVTWPDFRANNPTGDYMWIDMPAGDSGVGMENAGYLSAWCLFGITKSSSYP
jgi:ABC-type glycerol-3-phosphate transport system substrate-binding protein